MNLSEFPLSSPSLPLAFAEIALLLSIAVITGFWLAKSIASRKTRHLLSLIDEKKYELSQLRIQANNDMNQPIATNASRTVYPELSPDHEPDDLKLIEGIGPKTEEILNAHGIHTYEQLAETPSLRLAAMLRKAGPRFQMQDPSSWSIQAEMAQKHKWQELSQFQQKLISGQL